MKIKRCKLFFLFIIVLPHCGYSDRQQAPDTRLHNLFEKFARIYPSLGITDFNLDYKQNFSAIATKRVLENREIFFVQISREIKKINRGALQKNDRYDLDHLSYIVRFNLQRITLEKQLLNDYPDKSVPDGGLFGLKNGKNWYKFYLKKYTSLDIDPDSLYRFGLNEVKHVQDAIGKIRDALGYAGNEAGFYTYLKNDSFFLTDKTDIEKGYDNIRTTIYQNLGKLFYDTAVPLVSIREIENATANSPPGFYIPANTNKDTGVFYYNNYFHKYNKRAMQWLFLHEAVPGHHYDAVIESKLTSLPSFDTLFSFAYNGFFEGWAAYVEDLGKPLGLYNNNTDYLGELEWDLVRSARICLDVGINYLGWSKAKAMAFWKDNIRGQDDIAEREVTRCTNWVGQVNSYKVGKAKILALKKWASDKKGSSFDVRKFHALIFSRGGMPLQVLEEIIKENI